MVAVCEREVVSFSVFPSRLGIVWGGLSCEGLSGLRNIQLRGSVISDVDLHRSKCGPQAAAVHRWGAQ